MSGVQNHAHAALSIVHQLPVCVLIFLTPLAQDFGACPVKSVFGGLWAEYVAAHVAGALHHGSGRNMSTCHSC